jgi:hypothetical protein
MEPNTSTVRKKCCGHKGNAFWPAGGFEGQTKIIQKESEEGPTYKY